MDTFLFILLFFFSIFFVLFKKKKSKKLDQIILENEVDKDFKTEFETDTQGNLTEKGMEELITWSEENLNDRDTIILDEIKKLNQ